MVRRAADRGVVAILDSRMMTARYAGFLQKSLPPFWPTTDKAMVMAALRRLDEGAAEPLEVHEPALRGVSGAVDDTTLADPASEEPDQPVAEAPTVVEPPPVAPSARTAVTHGRAWTPAEDEELREGVELGLTLDELASHLDLLDEVVAARLAMLDLVASDAPKMF